MSVKIYLIKSGKEENSFSHDWGGEFYFDKEQALDRARELQDCRDIDIQMGEDVSETRFEVVEAGITESLNENPTQKISITWAIEDVLQMAEEMDVELTDEEAGEILENIERHHDAELGISWTTIQCAIEDHMHDRK